MNREIIIFTDGASINNPGNAGWGSVIIFNKKEVLEIGGFEKKSTNNRMELTATIESLSTVRQRVGDKYQITLFSDSSYVINGITKWISGWISKNWIGANKNPVLNKDLWEKLNELNNFLNIKWKLLPGHSGICGNEKADKIATGFAGRENMRLFMGPIGGYEKNILNTNFITGDGKRKNMKVYSYLSMVDGILKRHETWRECEERVKGKSNVRFKKALDKSDEEKIINEWRGKK